MFIYATQFLQWVNSTGCLTYIECLGYPILIWVVTGIILQWRLYYNIIPVTDPDQHRIAQTFYVWWSLMYDGETCKVIINNNEFRLQMKTSGASLPCNHVILPERSDVGYAWKRRVHCEYVGRNPKRHCAGYW